MIYGYQHYYDNNHLTTAATTVSDVLF